MSKEKIKFYKNKHCYINIAVGLLITIASHFIENTRFGIKNLDYIFDFYIKQESLHAQETAYELGVNKNLSRDLVFIDYNYEKYKEWNYPILTPRTEIARDLFVADSCGAKIIVLDFLLDKEDCCNPRGDDSLKNVLQLISQNKKTIVVFSVLIGVDKKIKPGILDEIINQNNNFYRALPFVVTSSHDGMVRYSGNYDYYLDNNETGKTVIKKLYAIPELVSKLINNVDIHGEKLLGTEEELNTKKISEINELSAVQNEDEKLLYERRIRYFIIPDKPGLSPRTGNLPLEQYFTPDNIIPENLKNKIVLIGSSSPESGDYHYTRIGFIPGMYVLGNVINTEIMNLYPRQISDFLKYLIELIIIVFSAYVFICTDIFKARIIVSILLLLILGFINWLIFFKYGIFINFILPVIGMRSHAFIGNIERWFTPGHKQELSVSSE